MAGGVLRRRVQSYMEELSRALGSIDLTGVETLLGELMRVWRERRQVLIIGNGGSAALASHMANDLSKAVVVPGMPRLRAISLCDNVPLLTAWANDTDYDNVFAEPIRNLCQPGDLVLAVSCSGSSGNVVRGLQVAREMGARTALLTGDRGGRACDLADVNVFAPVATVPQQEDVHLALNHVISQAMREWLQDIAERSTRPPRALVLAAGEGTRLRPLTLKTPKTMVPVAGRPVLEHTLAWLRRHGVSEVAINLHHLPRMIVDHFGDGSALGLHLTYSYEDTILGTAGAVRNLNGFLSDGPLVVVYGDVLTNLDLGALLRFHHQNVTRDPATLVTMSLYRVPNPTEVGLVGIANDGRVTRFLEKPAREEVFTDVASAGVLVVEPAIADYIPERHRYDLGLDLFPRLLMEGVSMYGWIPPDGTYVLDIGTPEKYAQAQREWPLVERQVRP